MLDQAAVDRVASIYFTRAGEIRATMAEATAGRSPDPGPTGPGAELLPGRRARGSPPPAPAPAPAAQAPSAAASAPLPTRQPDPAVAPANPAAAPAPAPVLTPG